MLLFTFQIGTIFCMFFLFLLLFVRPKNEKWKKNNKQGALWKVRAIRVGKAKKTFAYYFFPPDYLKDEIVLQTGVYTLGNRIWNDVYLDVAEEPVKIHLNVQQNQVYLTVLKGHVTIQSYHYHANSKENILLEDMSRVEIGEILLQFSKRRMI